MIRNFQFLGSTGSLSRGNRGTIFPAFAKGYGGRSNFQKGSPRAIHPELCRRKSRGFTLIEVIIAIAVFSLFAAGAYQGYLSLQAAILSARYKALAADLANARFEIIKNLPYSNVGIEGGNPPGVVSAEESAISDNVTFTITTTIINIDDPFDGLAGSGDAFPGDYKLVEVKIACMTCKNFTPIAITGWVAPKNLEST